MSFVHEPSHQLIISGDGSHTIYLPQLNETYHSSHGAITESEHIYIRNGLNSLNKTKVKVLEIGFGTGLNALLSFKESQIRAIDIDYHSLEPFPIPASVYEELNYSEKLGYQEGFRYLHQSEFGNKYQLGTNFSFQKYSDKIEDFQSELSFDIVYYDAFAPSKQSEMWDTPIFEKLMQMLVSGGILVSYCASGAFKRSLKIAGFGVETLPGPPGKKEMTKAKKILDL